MVDRTNHHRRLLNRGCGFKSGGNISSSTPERVDTRAVRTTANITFLQQGYKPKKKDTGSEENKQFDPGGKGEKATLWHAAVTLSFFLWGEHSAMGGSLLMMCFFFSVCLSALFFVYCSFQVITSHRAEKYERRRGPNH